MITRRRKRLLPSAAFLAVTVTAALWSAPTWAVDRSPSTTRDVPATGAVAAPTAASHAAISDAAGAALDWLERELENNGFAMPAPFGVGTDWGLTADAVLGLVAGARADAPVTVDTAHNVVTNAADFLTGQSFGAPHDVYAGPAGKVLLVAETLGIDTTNIAGRDLEATARSLMQTSGAQAGRFSDVSAFGDTSNGFSQALMILALARTQHGIPSAALSFLLAQQCPGGGFRLFYAASPGDPTGCVADADADTDATALAIQAMLAAPSMPSTARIDRAFTWLAGKQDANGAFSGTGPTAVPNANSTGLAGAANHDAGHAETAANAQLWLESVQLTETDPSLSAAADDAGAIAYDDAARDAAVESGIPSEERDQFRRATAQAVLGLGIASYATMGGHESAPLEPGAVTSNAKPEPGDTITIDGTGFLTDEPVTATLHSHPIPIGTKPATRGAVRFDVTIPVDLAAGAHTVSLVGRVSGATTSVALQVQGASGATTVPVGSSGNTTDTVSGAGRSSTTGSGTLPRTGENVSSMLLLSFAAIALGGLAAGTSRRRATRARP